jgi:hypothetical protein
VRCIGCDQKSKGTVFRLDERSPQHTLTALAFWRRVMLERPPSPDPPTWEELFA